MPADKAAAALSLLISTTLPVLHQRFNVPLRNGRACLYDPDFFPADLKQEESDLLHQLRSADLRVDHQGWQQKHTRCIAVWELEKIPFFYEKISDF